MKKIIITLLAVSLLAAGCSKKTSQNDNSKNDKGQQQAQEHKKSTLKQLIDAGKPQKCEVSYKLNETTSTSGTSYMAGRGKFRGDFATQVNGQVQQSHVIMSGDTLYTWTEGQTIGFKMQVNQQASASTTQQAINFEQQMEYNCQDWKEDNSVFSIPTNITFKDQASITKLQSGSNSATGSNTTIPDKKVMCAACDQAGSSKAQCLAALGCN